MFSILRRLFPSDPSPTITILGLDNAGKTTLLHALKPKKSEVVTTIPTIGMVIENTRLEIILNSEKKAAFKAQVYDTGGCSKVSDLVRRLLVDTADAIVWIVDATDRERVDESAQELAALFPEENEVASHLPFMM